MPWDVFRTGPESKPYCIHKVDEDGEPIGKPLGCHPSQEAAEEQLAALHANVDEAKVVHVVWRSAKAVGDWELEVLGVPFFGPVNGKDADGEFFTPKTDILLKVGDKRPVFYNHGADPANRKEIFPDVIGEATYIRADSKGHWFKVKLDQTSEYAARIMQSAKEGMARASSGAVNYLTRIVRKTGEVLVWALAELTLIDAEPGKREPANDYAVAYLKTAYEQANLQLPEGFAEDGEPSKAKATDKGCGRQVVNLKDPAYLYEIQSQRKR